MIPESIDHRLSQVSKGLLAALAAVPFLQSHHTLPLHGFYSEWLALLIGLLLMAAVFLQRGTWRPFRFPVIALLPCVLILMLLIQTLAGRVVTLQQNLLYGGGLLWLIMLMAAGRQLRLRLGPAEVAGSMAWGLFIGSMASSVIGLTQYFDLSPGTSWMFPRLGGAAPGNLGQTNHQADYLWLGVASAIYLAVRQRLSFAAIVAICLPLLLASVLTSSRSVFLYSAALGLLAVWIRRQHPGSMPAHAVAAIWLLLPLLLVINLLVVEFQPGATIATPMERLYESVEGPSARLALAQTALSIFMEHPVLGSGLGSFPWQSFLLAAKIPNSLVAEHAHNLFLHLAAEFGGLAMLGILVILLVWWRQALVVAKDSESWWALAIMAVIGLHSLLEYPLWYAYFAGVAAVVAGAWGRDVVTFSMGARGRAYMLAVFVIGMATLIKVRGDYKQLESVGQAQSRQMIIKDMVELRRNSLLAPWAGLALVAFADMDGNYIREDRILCETVMKFSAAFKVISRCAMLYAMEGDMAAAEALTRRLVAAFPRRTTELIADLRRVSQTFPEVRPLLVLIQSK